MPTLPRPGYPVACALAALLACSSWATHAQQTPPALTGEPAVSFTVVEDLGGRIEELRVRGQVRSITVRPALPGARPYEIVPTDGGRDMSDGPGNRRGAAGQRVWSVLTF